MSNLTEIIFQFIFFNVAGKYCILIGLMFTNKWLSRKKSQARFNVLDMSIYKLQGSRAQPIDIHDSQIDIRHILHHKRMVCMQQFCVLC